MREQIKDYVDKLFKDAAPTIRNAAVQQEILQHTLDRYDDLIAAGKTEQEAYEEAVGGIGDVSELYEHKPARDFPAPPESPYTAPAAAPAKKKKFPGWAVALICAGAAIIILALSFAGRAVDAVLHAGERYIYNSADSYETLARSGFGSGEQPAAAPELLSDIKEVEIHWLTGDVYLVESDTGSVTFQEDYTGSNDDYRLRYTVHDGRLDIQPCESRLFSSTDLPRKALTVFLPSDSVLDTITVETVSADVELLGGQTKTLDVSTTSGNITGPGLSAQKHSFGTVSGDLRLSALPVGGSVTVATVSGETRIDCTACPDTLRFNSVSGNLCLTLPESCQYTLDLSTVSGDRISDDFIPGGTEVCVITAETVSGDVEVRSAQ